MKTYIQGKVIASSQNPSEDKTEFPWLVLIETSKKFGELEVPDSQKCKSKVKLENGESPLLEVKITTFDRDMFYKILAIKDAKVKGV